MPSNEAVPIRRTLCFQVYEPDSSWPPIRQRLEAQRRKRIYLDEYEHPGRICCRYCDEVSIYLAPYVPYAPKTVGRMLSECSSLGNTCPYLSVLPCCTCIDRPASPTSSLSRKSATIFGQGTIPEPSTPHIGREVALVARTAAFVYI